MGRQVVYVKHDHGCLRSVGGCLLAVLMLAAAGGGLMWFFVWAGDQPSHPSAWSLSPPATRPTG